MSYEIAFGPLTGLVALVLVARFGFAWANSSPREAIARLRHGIDNVLVVVLACTGGVLLLHELVTDRVCSGHC